MYIYYMYLISSIIHSLEQSPPEPKLKIFKRHPLKVAATLSPGPRFPVATPYYRQCCSWTPRIQILIDFTRIEVLPAATEEGNEEYRYAAAIVKGGIVVGHVPRSFSKYSTSF